MFRRPPGPLKMLMVLEACEGFRVWRRPRELKPLGVRASVR